MIVTILNYFDQHSYYILYRLLQLSNDRFYKVAVEVECLPDGMKFLTLYLHNHLNLAMRSIVQCGKSSDLIFRIENCD